MLAVPWCFRNCMPWHSPCRVSSSCDIDGHIHVNIHFITSRIHLHEFLLVVSHLILMVMRSPRFVTSCTLAFLRHEACEVVRIDNKGWCLSGELKEVPKTCCMSALTFFMDSKTFITHLYLEAFNIIQQQNKSGLCGSRKGWSAKFGSHSAEQGWTLLQGQGHLDDNLRIFTDQNYVLV